MLGVVGIREAAPFSDRAKDPGLSHKPTALPDED